MAKYTPMIEQYLKIKAQVPDAFLFFRLGDFYELFFDDAKLASNELEITLTGREGGGHERIPMCGVPHHSVDSYIERLIERGYKVAICEQVESPSAAKGVVKREIVRIITPGTVMEEKMLQERENNFLVALFPVNQLVALAMVDLSTGELHVTEVPMQVSKVLDELSSYQPKEVVVEERMPRDDPILVGIKQQLGALITPSPLTVFEEAQLEEQFPRYQEVCTSPCLKAVLQLLFGYIQKTQKRSLQHVSRLSHYDPKQFMVINEAAKRNLELHKTLHEGKKKGSLLWLLDRTATAMGGRLLKRWLDRPLLQLDKIQARQKAVGAFVEDPIFLGEMIESLKQVYDLERLAARIAFGSATARDLSALSRSLCIVPEIKKSLLEQPVSEFHQLGEEMDTCEEVSRLVQQAIVEDPPLTLKEGGIIRDGYHADLDQLRLIQRDGKGWIARLEHQERESSGIKSLKVGYNRIFGYYIEVSKSNLRHIPQGRYIRKQTLANAERFITPELKEQEQLILQAAEKSIAMEYELFSQVRDEIASQVMRLQNLAEHIAELDCYQSLSQVASQYQYVCPQMVDVDEIYIEAGRHPVVEAVSSEYEFVANDAHLDVVEQQILLITGPNMAGKSTYMRQVALISIMAQMGSFVPANQAQLSIVDRVFTRIGAADDLVGGRSTFMVEMAETCRALQEATPRSLILLDEVGRGTSTYDGMALAHAIVEYIHDHIGAKTLFSTHYHELTVLEDVLSRLKNIHAECVEREGKVVFLHRMALGGADRSYGIHVAELAGLPESVIDRARVLLTQLESRMEAASTLTDSHDSMKQMSLFSVDKPLSMEVHEEKLKIKSPEKKILQQLSAWDVMNKTPFETMQLVLELKQKLLSDD